MLGKWLKVEENNDASYVFKVINITETQIPDDKTRGYLGQEILKAYTNIDHVKFLYCEEPEEKLIQYIYDYILPSDKNQITKNVQQGDFGEILASLIVEHFMGLTVPIRKLKWKFNKDRSMFCTDMIAHNIEGTISDIYYYEIKTRLSCRKEKVGKNGITSYVTVNAHNSLLKDEQTPNEGIANFLSNYHYEMGDYDKASQYGEIVIHPENYNRNFELLFIIEKSKYIKDILEDLHNLPPTLDPLCVTLVLINQLGRMIIETKKLVINKACQYVYENK